LGYHGSKFDGTVEEFYEKALEAYAGIETEGFLNSVY